MPENVDSMFAKCDLDIDRQVTFSEYMAENPNDVQFGLGVNLIYECTCAQNVSKLNACPFGVGSDDRDNHEYAVPIVSGASS